LEKHHLPLPLRHVFRVAVSAREVRDGRLFEQDEVERIHFIG
jgi:hypothetical protein